METGFRTRLERRSGCASRRVPLALGLPWAHPLGANREGIDSRHEKTRRNLEGQRPRPDIEAEPHKVAGGNQQRSIGSIYRRRQEIIQIGQSRPCRDGAQGGPDDSSRPSASTSPERSWAIPSNQETPTSMTSSTVSRGHDFMGWNERTQHLARMIYTSSMISETISWREAPSAGVEPARGNPAVFETAALPDQAPWAAEHPE